METFAKFFPIVAALLVLLQSCVMTSVEDEIDETVQAEQLYTTKAENDKEGYFALHLRNDADNTVLRIDSVEICNILVDGSGAGDVQRGSIMLYEADGVAGEVAGGSGITAYEVKVPVQTLEPWTPGLHPAAGKGAYAGIYGSVCSFLYSNETYVLYEGTMYYPLSGVVTESGISQISIVVNVDCPLYAQLGGRMEKVLVPITFSVFVDPWR